MRHSLDPRQNWLFDPSLSCCSALAHKRLLEDWPGVFRTCLLELMPVEEVAEHFDESIGRPTKELYSACGLLLLMEFNDWTVRAASDAYMFDGRVQFALNLGREFQSMSTRTVERYQRLFRQDRLARQVMGRVTGRLVKLLELEVDKLRLDSTHVFSNMASFGRSRLVATATRRFLIQLKRHEQEKYAALPAELRERYRKGSWEFGQGGHGGLKREVAAADMHRLIGAFEADESVCMRSSFKGLRRIFCEPCEVVEGKEGIIAKPGLDTMQNPSDPEATFDARKGPGYQVQTAETCAAENETQLVVSAIAQTACEHNQNALEPVVEDLEDKGIEPSGIVADAGYGGDRNWCACAEKGIKLTAPVIQGRQKKGRIELNEFSLSGCGVVESCPLGATPLRAWFSPDKERAGATFRKEHCQGCAKLALCQVRKNGKNYCMYYDSRAAATETIQKIVRGRLLQGAGSRLRRRIHGLLGAVCAFAARLISAAMPPSQRSRQLQIPETAH